jgi:hypothetical protein
MQPSQLDQLVKLIKADLSDDWSRLYELEGRSEEAVRRRLREYSRHYAVAGIPPEIATLCGKLVKHFANTYRHQMVGREEGNSETKPIPPDLIRPEALRFAPDQLVHDKGKLVFVDVRIEPAPAPAQLPSPSAAPVRKLSGKEWIPLAFARRRDELLALTITEAGHRLAEESKTAPDCAKPLKPRTAEKLLRNLGLWPQAFRGLPKQRPTK